MDAGTGSKPNPAPNNELIQQSSVFLTEVTGGSSRSSFFVKMENSSMNSHPDSPSDDIIGQPSSQPGNIGCEQVADQETSSKLKISQSFSETPLKKMAYGCH